MVFLEEMTDVRVKCSIPELIVSANLKYIYMDMICNRKCLVMYSLHNCM